jgi:hypothetical protein
VGVYDFGTGLWGITISVLVLTILFVTFPLSMINHVSMIAVLCALLCCFEYLGL